MIGRFCALGSALLIFMLLASYPSQSSAQAADDAGEKVTKPLTHCFNAANYSKFLEKLALPENKAIVQRVKERLKARATSGMRRESNGARSRVARLRNLQGVSGCGRRSVSIMDYAVPTGSAHLHRRAEEGRILRAVALNMNRRSSRSGMQQVAEYAEIGEETESFDLGEYGVWDVSEELYDEEFWAADILDPVWVTYISVIVQQPVCVDTYATCTKTTARLKTGAMVACGTVASLNLAVGLVCAGAVDWLSDQADNQCLIDYAGCNADLSLETNNLDFAVASLTRTGQTSRSLTQMEGSPYPQDLRFARGSNS